jgi:hypothetical protein
MSRAVEASLKDAYQDDVLEELLLADQVRKGGRQVETKNSTDPLL